jgi:hypothetical protein
MINDKDNSAGRPTGRLTTMGWGAPRLHLCLLICNNNIWMGGGG